VRRVVVTGGTGFVGRRTVPLLIERGFQPWLVARSDEAATKARAMGAEVVMADLGDVAMLQRAFSDSGSDVLLNIASLGFGHGPGIVEACRASGIRRAVFVSTTAMFTTLNASTKATRIAAEDAITSSGLDYTIIRPTMIYGGPDDRNVCRLLTALERRPIMPLPGGGRGLQQPVHVEDLAEVLVAAIDRAVSIGKAYNVAGRDVLSFREMVLECGRALGRRVTVVPVPLAPVLMAARLNERFVKTPRLKAEQFERLAEDKSFDNGPATEDLGLDVRTFAQGVRDELVEIGRTRQKRVLHA
jgi:uncharacterized protein YbjT (DUF2867 family)